MTPTPIEVEVSRRKLLKWTPPLVLFVTLPSHAQTSDEIPDPPGPDPDPDPPGPDPDPDPPAITGAISITEILYRQTASSDPTVLVDEYVEIRNDDAVPIDLTAWTLTDAGPFSFTFPSKVIMPGETCRIFSHAPQGANTWPCEYTFGLTSPGSPGNYVFNNGGDTANLLDSSGTLIDSCSYTSSDASHYSC